MIGTGTAILGSTLLSGAMNAFGAHGANKAAKNNAAAAAANTNAANQAVHQAIEPAWSHWQQGADQAAGYFGEGYGNVMGAYQPMADQFGSGIGQMYGAQNPNVNPYLSANFEDFDPGDFKQSPGYQHILKEGLDAVQNSAAAGGSGLYSGNTLRGITDYASGVASQDYDNWWKRKMGEAGFDANQELRRYGVQADNYGRDFGQQVDARNFNYGRAQDLTNIGIGGIAGQADTTGGYYGAMGQIYGDLYSRQGDSIINAGNTYSNNLMGNAGMQTQTPYVSPYGGMNQALQGGLQNWMWYQSQQPQGVKPQGQQGVHYNPGANSWGP